MSCRRGAWEKRWGSNCRCSRTFAVVPVILLIMRIPVTINGLGTTQVAFVALLGAAGAGVAQTTALSILFLALGVIGSLPGGLIYAFADRAERPGAQPS